MNHSSIQLNTEVGYRYQKVQDQRKSSALVLRLPLSHSLSPSNRKGEPHIVHHTLTHPQPTHQPTHTQAERPQSQITDGQPQTLDSRDSHCTTGMPTSYTPYLVTTGSICLLCYPKLRVAPTQVSFSTPDAITVIKIQPDFHAVGYKAKVGMTRMSTRTIPTHRVYHCDRR